jgi:exosortase A-associated hydrolase 1
MNVEEIPVAFDCCGETLIGIVHAPQPAATQGVLIVVAGGPQYRAGCCRQLTQIARQLAANGVAVMRFDYRGLGDGGGEYRGFQDIYDDLAAALNTIQRVAPSVREITLWGGCDAASASMLHGWRFPQVTGMILGNPFASSAESRAKVIVRHYYLDRFRDKAFWKKVFSLRFNPFKTLPDLLGNLWRSAGMGGAKANAKHKGKGDGELGDGPFPDRMREGFKRFGGRTLLLMSGESLVRKEFDELVARSPEWTRLLARPSVTRHDIPAADQAFSTLAAREEVLTASLDWLAMSGSKATSA